MSGKEGLPKGDLRPLWRFFISAVLIVFVYLAVLSLLPAIYAVTGQPVFFIRFFWERLALLVAFLALFKALISVFERRPLSSVGLAFYGRWKMDLALGMGLGASMIFLVATSERLLGLVSFARSPRPTTQLLATGLFFCALLLVAAAAEELAFRGYPFQRLVEALGPIGAVGVSSVLFGLVHLRNPYHSGYSTFNTVLIGVPLGLAYLRTRALWMPIGIHFAWNFVEGYGLGLPVSGVLMPSPVFRASVEGAVWLTGADYGPEGGLMASVAILAGTLYLLLAKGIYLSEEMKALVTGKTTEREDTPNVVV